METVDTTKRLSRLRELMRQHNIGAYIIPWTDSHNSEYTLPEHRRGEYISGFTGSAGTLVVTLHKATLSTDGRYFLQASKQLDHNWTLLRQGLPHVPTWQEWTIQQSDGQAVGVDPSLITASDGQELSSSLAKSGSKLLGLSQNLVEKVWPDRPQTSGGRIFIHPEKYAGVSMQDKLQDLRKELSKKNASAMVVSMLDEIAWLFNLRGSDIDYNPVFFSYAVVTPTSTTLYVDSGKFNPDVKAYLESTVDIKPYNTFFADLPRVTEATINGVSQSSTSSRSQILISNNTSWSVSLALGGTDKVKILRSPIEEAKAVKNATEIDGMRRCHVRDGAALSEYLAWLEHELQDGARITELEAAARLDQIRAKGELFMGLSFQTTSASGKNAAVIHYKSDPLNCPVIDPNAVYLCDSGAQYLDGTTDTTRTVHCGKPTAYERKVYTLVLKGTISVDRMIFPKGVSGFAIDNFARQHLWREGLDYRHGTGHGIGSFLNCHEGPIGLSTRTIFADIPMSVGNVISNEPGYYEEGNFGIRIENAIMAKEVKLAHNFGNNTWIGFETATLVPMCSNLIDPALLEPTERDWLNHYHRKVWEETHAFFEADERTMKWLKRETAPI